ncbi:MAG: hypothetical protein KIS87_04810 [Phycisphaeraceae bacterium]|nr:hypothetical protein [Phycisphaeraceae bacterium]
MFIKRIVIDGANAEVEIRRTERGAAVTALGITVEVARDSSRPERYRIAHDAARVIYALPLGGGASDAANSMIRDVLREIERVAGC